MNETNENPTTTEMEPYNIGEILVSVTHRYHYLLSGLSEDKKKLIIDIIDKDEIFSEVRSVDIDLQTAITSVFPNEFLTVVKSNHPINPEHKSLKIKVGDVVLFKNHYFGEDLKKEYIGTVYPSDNKDFVAIKVTDVSNTPFYYAKEKLPLLFSEGLIEVL